MSEGTTKGKTITCINKVMVFFLWRIHAQSELLKALGFTIRYHSAAGSGQQHIYYFQYTAPSDYFLQTTDFYRWFFSYAGIS